MVKARKRRDKIEELSGSEVEELIQKNLERHTGTIAVGQQAAGIAEKPATEVSEGLLATLEDSVQPKVEPDAFSVVMKKQTNQEWKGVESTRSLGYNGQSGRTKRCQRKTARDKEAVDAETRKE